MMATLESADLVDRGQQAAAFGANLVQKLKSPARLRHVGEGAII